MTRTSQVIYVAAPVAHFDSASYQRLVDLLRRRGAQVLSSRDLFASTDEWRARWSDVLAQATSVVVLLGPDRVIGGGCAQEILDARLRGVPVWFFVNDHQFIPLQQVRLQFTLGVSRQRFARVDLPSQTKRPTS